MAFDFLYLDIAAMFKQGRPDPLVNQAADPAFKISVHRIISWQV